MTIELQGDPAMHKAMVDGQLYDANQAVTVGEQFRYWIITLHGPLSPPPPLVVLRRECCNNVIDFESIPGGGTPTERMAINTQFLATHGVTFRLEDGRSPVIAQVEPPRTAFGGPPNNTGADTPAAGQNIGTFFLTDDGTVDSGSNPPALIVEYTPPTNAASGVILDIDASLDDPNDSETFTIEARDATGAVLNKVIILKAGDPNTGDGVATPWVLHRPTNDIASIRFKGSRQAAAFGLGFDNLQSACLLFGQ